ncbi:hypothetical protein [Microbulbifer thermotolerans]|uniref:hypothetical protein n=1 Tax=Microbulbifer thermotolerans TaxID=252514 RepID=UPI00224B6A19|nr:hypothetical protein [Microbulbifer thermotolerans]MCX2781044.1 hypothetical protein [Microbulbifer thermotolerans]MCX2806361.1 hypothetical protein [Microbulbifer thermotolerans]
MKKVIPILSLLFFCGASFAESIIITGKVTRIYGYEDTINFHLEGNTECNPNNQYYYFNLDSEGKKAWYSLLLAAANTSKPIHVKIPECPINDKVKIIYLYQNF